MPEPALPLPEDAASPPIQGEPRAGVALESNSSGENVVPIEQTHPVPTFVTPITPVFPPQGDLPALPAAPQSGFELRALAAPPVGDWRPGLEFDDFRIVRALGEGAFGQVLLAQQLSLDRLVALKVTANCGQEGRTLASLEHEHIVQVFSERVDSTGRVRWLCMQYVPGTTLAKVVQYLRRRDPADWSGQLLLDVIDTLSQEPTAFHPAALRDRQVLADADWIETVCWLGARLAEALDYAHCRGVLHRDVKPANILINPYGRPFLADFNLATRPRPDAADSELFGGTLGYMAPEHLHACVTEVDADRQLVDSRSDLYALGFALFELLTGQRPFAEPPLSGEPREALKALLEGRQASPLAARALCEVVPPALDYTLRRCLQPDPKLRYQSGRDLADALEGCRELRRAEKATPDQGRLTSLIRLRPFLWLAALVMAPQFLGSVVNIVYNQSAIVGDLTARQQTAFAWLVLIYNLVVYPLCVAKAYHLLMPVLRGWRALERRPPVEPPPLDPLRRLALTWPLWVVWLSCLGWLPGAILFPICLSLFAEPVTWTVFGHFLLSFALSGLITLTYSFFAVQYVVIRILYLPLWHDARNVHAVMSSELAGIDRRLRLFQLLAGIIPLVAAALMVAVGPELSSDRAFRVLVTALMGLSMAGFGLALFAHNTLAHLLTLLTAGAKASR